MRAKLVAVIMLLMLAASSIPFVGGETVITWLTYMAIPLVILAGSAGVAFYTKRVEAVIGGMVMAALIPALLKAL